MDNLQRLFKAFEAREHDAVTEEISRISSQIKSLNPTTKELYLLELFESECNIVLFLEKASRYAKIYKKDIKTLLELINLVLTQFNESFKYAENIIAMCKAMLVSSLVGSSEKVESLQILCIIFKKEDDKMNEYADDIYKTSYMLMFDSKTGVTVTEHYFKLIGILSKNYPSVIQNSTKLLQDLLKNINMAIITKHNVNVGHIECLSDFLENFTIDKESELCKQLYNCVKNTITPSEQSKVIFRAAASLFSKHFELIEEQVYHNYLFLYETFQTWLESNNNYDCKAAFDATLTLYECLNKMVEEKQDAHGKSLLKTLLDKFISVIDDDNKVGFKMRLGIIGLGIFATSCNATLTPEEILAIFSKIHQKINFIYLLDNSLLYKYETYLPNYIETLTKWMFCVSKIENQTEILEQITILLIKIFPRLSKMYHAMVVLSFLSTLCIINKENPAIFDKYLQNIIYISIIYTCSHQIKQTEEIDSKTTTYLTFLPFWKGLLQVKTINNKVIMENDIENVQKKLYDELIKTLFVLIAKLNLKVHNKDIEDVLTDPNLALEAVVVNDIDIFVNLVDLYVDLLEISPVNFEKCLPQFINYIVAMSFKNPLISGFYKLLTVAVKFNNEHNCLNENSIEILQRFLLNLLENVDSYKEDLLVACLVLILNSPLSILQENFGKVIMVFNKVFEMGKSYLKLAEIGLDTLEKWIDILTNNEFNLLFGELVPILDSYLCSKVVLRDQTSNKLVVKAKRSKTNLKKLKINVEEELELTNLRRRILMFVTKLSFEQCRLLAGSGNKIEHVVWSDTKHLKVVLPFENQSCTVFLDTFVPRILDVALNCSDRKTRMAACELLHSIVILILGEGRTLSEKNKDNLKLILEKILTAVVELSCSVDQTIQSIFCPLLQQLVHWYAHPSQINSTNTSVLLSVLTDLACHQDNTAINDTCGLCLKEFVIYTRKQCLQKDFFSIEEIINKIHLFCTHPDKYKQKGALIIFNNIYMEIREEEDIINKHWFNLTHSLIINLSNIKENNNFNLQLANNALDHIQRVLIAKENLFNQYNKERLIPFNLKETATLCDLLQFIFEQTTSLNVNLRKKCQSMFIDIAKGIKNKQILNGIIPENFKIDCLYGHVLNKNLTLKSLVPIKNLSDLFDWLNSFLCTLNGYIFILKLKQLNIIREFDMNTAFLLNSLQSFYEISHLKLRDVLKMFTINLNIKFTSLDVENFNLLKTKIAKELIALINIFISEYKNLQDDFKNSFFTNDLFTFISRFLFTTFKLGFYENINKEQTNLSSLIHVLIENLPQEKLQEFTNVLNTFINDGLTKNYLNSNIPCDQKQLVNGLIILQKSSLNLNLSSISLMMVHSIFTEMFLKENDKYTIVKLNKTSLDHCSLKIQLSLCYINNLSNIKNYLFNSDCFEKEKPTEYFFITFKDLFAPYLVKNCEEFVNIIFDGSLSQNNYIVLKELLNMLQKDLKKFDSNKVSVILQGVLSNWKKLNSYFENVNEDTRILSSVEFYNQVFGLNAHKDILEHLQMEKEFLDWIKTLVIEQNVNLENFLIEVVKLLPCFYTSLEANFIKLECIFEILKVKYFQEIQNETTLILTLTNIFKSTLLTNLSKLILLVVDLYITTNVKVEIDSYLQKFAINCQNTEMENLLTSIFNSFEKYTDKEKYKLATTVLQPLIKHCKYENFETFYCENIQKIIEILEKPLQFDETITFKTISFMLIESLFAKINIESLDNNSSAIMQKLNINAKKDFCLKFCKFCIEKRSENFEIGDVIIKENLRLFHSHAYIAFMSIISNTNKEIDNYMPLFGHMKNGDDVLWKNMIDLEKKYKFQVMFDEIPKRRKILLNIRTEKKMEQPKHYESGSLLYFQSQKLFNSTLKEDVFKYDFTNSLVRSQINEENIIKNEITNLEIELEDIDINEHVCMSRICGLIAHIFNNGIQTIPDDDDEVMELPKWMQCFSKILFKNTTPTNVRLFLIKVIENCEYAFKPYGKYFMEPIMQAIVDGCAGQEINFYISDLIKMIVLWHKPSVDISPNLPSALLEFLIDHTYNNERIDIFKHNLDLLKTYVETFKGVLTIPHAKLMKMLQTKELIETAVHITAICLVNNLAPWPMGKEIQTMLMSILKNLDNHNKGKKKLYHPSAETLGMALHFMSKNAIYKKCVDNFLPILQNQLSKIADCDQKLFCIAGVAKYHNIIIEHHLPYLVNQLPKVQSYFKSLILDTILLANDEILQNPNMLLVDFKNLLVVNSEVSTQISALKILNKFVEFNQVNYNVLKSIKELIFYSETSVRILVYDLFIKLFNKHKNNIENDVFKISHSVLLHGLIEVNEEIENKLLNFWCGEANLPCTASNRFLYLLEHLYEPDIEDNFLGYSMFILLKLLEHSTNYKRVIYTENLLDCAFEEYSPIDWRKRYNSMMPMFVSSQKSQASFSFGSLKENMMILTQQSREFEPTQAPIEHQSTIKGSSLLFSNLPVTENQNFKNPNNFALSQKYRKRFFKDKRNVNMEIAIRQVNKGYEEREEQKELVKEKVHSVKFFRKYKMGEFPNIQINLCEVIDPLRMLAKYDDCIAQHLFTNLFEVIIRHEVNSEFEENARKCLGNVLKSSKDFNSHVIRAVLEVLYTNDIKLNPDLVSLASERSGLMSIGSLLLEDYVQSDFLLEPPAKKVKGENSQEVNCWTKIANLYKAMDEWDVVSAIFMEKMECPEDVEKAILAEARGDWNSAVSFYSNACHEDSSLDRKDFYYESLFKCFAHMSQWSELSNEINTTVNTNGDIWDSLWADHWNQNKLMPWYIKAEIRNSSENTEKRKELLIKFNEFLSDQSKSSIFRSSYLEELAYLWLSIGKIDNAKVYLNEYIDDFLNSWIEINPTYTNLRVNKLLNMQLTLDMLVFINNARNLEEEPLRIEKILQHLHKSISNSQSIVLTETRQFYRNECIEYLKIITDLDVLNKIQGDMLLEIFNKAVEESNYHMALKYYQQINQIDELEDLDKTLSVSKLYLLKSELSENGFDIRIVVKAWQKIDSILNMEELSIENQLKVNKEIFEITKILAQNSETNENIEILQELTNSNNILNKEDVKQYGLNLYSNILTKLEETTQIENKPNIKNSLANGYLQLAYSIYKNLPKHEDIFIKFVLKAMFYGSEEARQLFPCLLNCKSLENENKALFISETNKIPTWLFIQWIPQLLAGLDTFTAFAISELIIRISKEYPQAIIYPFKVTTEKINNENEQRCKILKNIQEIIKDKLEIVDELTENLEKMCDKVSKIKDAHKKSIKLKDVSQFLTKYSYTNFKCQLEIPGLYTGFSKPCTRLHAKIVSFSQDVKVFMSLRKPVKISLLGSDGKYYSFIVKTKEDLRQDQRVLQVFNVMNGIYKADERCSNKNLKIHTYNVVPMTSNMGLLEFVSNTKEMNAFILSGIDFNIISNAHKKFVDFFDKNKSKCVSVNVVLQKYNDINSMVPKNVLSKAFFKISINVEAYFQLRQKFARSYATMCLSNWILGVGDRHFGNILLSKTSGECIGIDFGYVFGSGTSLLEFPELVPFRLTDVILNLMLPLKEQGFLKESMVHCLRALKHRQQSILATLNVFAIEPLKTKFPNSQTPNVLMSRAFRKLNGENPSVIFNEELQVAFENHKVPREKLHLLSKCILGSSDSYRAKVGHTDLNVEDQVTCLLEQAMDPNLLGRMHCGWQPWL